MQPETGCEECGGDLAFDLCETVCKSCGLVADEDPINFGEESFTDDPEAAARRRRTGPPVTWLNPDTSTTFDRFKSRNIYVSRRSRKKH